MLDNVRCRVNDPWDKHLPSGELYVLPHLPLMLMAPVSCHNGHGGWPRREQHIDNVSERHVVVARRLPCPPAHVHADLLRWNVSGGMVQRLHVLGDHGAELLDREVRKPGAAEGQIGAVELEKETRLDNRFILPLHYFR